MSGVHEDGRLVVLENGSKWEILGDDDRRKVAAWGPVNVWVSWDKFGTGDYVLAPANESDAVRARFAGPA